MELFLNLVWLSLSVFLVTGCVRSLRKGTSGLNFTAVVAVGLLVALLLPAISMTDDLMAMNSPAEVEHVIHRHEHSPFQATSVALLGFVSLLALALSAVVSFGVISARIWPYSFSARVLAGRARSLGIRGPSNFAIS